MTLARTRFSFALVLLLTAAVVEGAPIGPRLAAHLETLAPDEPVAVIVHLKGGIDPHRFKTGEHRQRRRDLVRELRSTAERDEAPLRPELEAEGGRRTRSLWLIHALSVTVPARAVGRLARRPDVESVTLDGTLAAPTPAAPVAAQPEWNLELINAPILWQKGFYGQGAVVASLDTGVDVNHPDLAGRWRGGSNSWFDPNGEHATPYDPQGHGTQTMGLMVGGDAGGTAIGVAPGARWISAKIFDDAGVASYSAIHLAYQWLLDPDGDPDTDDAPQVVNNSWGLVDAVGQCVTEFQPDLDALRAASIGLVFSGGNAGPAGGTSLSPANNPGNVSVGAVDALAEVPNYSSRGPSACDGGVYPSLVAPGDNVRTADLTFNGLFPDSYLSVSGTSYASAHVAGAIALLKSAVPDATAEQIETALRVTARDVGAPGADNDSGAGLIDLAAAEVRLLALVASTRAGSLQFAAESYRATEESGAITVTVARSGGSAGVVSVAYATADGSALAGVDYEPAAGTLTFADGETSRSFTVRLLDDAFPELDESFEVRLFNPDVATLGWPDRAAVTIVDGDLDDADGDGFAVDVDCDDADASVHPGAQEVKHDGVDQDCNGFDLTIDIRKARYYRRGDTLVVWAHSDLGGAAELELAGFGSMHWNPRRRLWTARVRDLESAPRAVSVQGVEGRISAPVNRPKHLERLTRRHDR